MRSQVGAQESSEVGGRLCLKKGWKARGRVRREKRSPPSRAGAPPSARRPWTQVPPPPAAEAAARERDPRPQRRPGSVGDERPQRLGANRPP